MTVEYLIEAKACAASGSSAEAVYDLVSRYDFEAPGFALLRLSDIANSVTFRHALVDLKEALSAIHSRKHGLMLDWFTMSRFDQKNTTKLHRDGGPDESLLILGYEPTSVISDVFIADYSACAHQLKITPAQFLEDFNPMYEKGVEKLVPFTRLLSQFDRTAYQILIVNNSQCQFDAVGRNWQGVLHGATITPDTEGYSRVINSTSVVPRATEAQSYISEEQLKEFLSDNDLATASYG